MQKFTYTCSPGLIRKLASLPEEGHTELAEMLATVDEAEAACAAYLADTEACPYGYQRLAIKSVKALLLWQGQYLLPNVEGALVQATAEVLCEGGVELCDLVANAIELVEHKSDAETALRAVGDRLLCLYLGALDAYKHAVAAVCNGGRPETDPDVDDLFTLAEETLAVYKGEAEYALPYITHLANVAQ